ncbi:MAG: PQQ-binding-like beta-propeller repeat protein [Planctomycetota bacterium]
MQAALFSWKRGGRVADKALANLTCYSVLVSLSVISLSAKEIVAAEGVGADQRDDEASADGLIASPEPDWPQWRGQRRDGMVDETGLLGHWPEAGPESPWALDGLGQGWSSPIVVNGRLYITGDVGEDLVIFALESDGTVRWRAKNGRAWTGSYPGARATCVFSEGHIYHLNAHGRVACLTADAGEEVWAVNILQRFDGKNITWGLSECLLVDGEHVVVTPGGKKGLMAALDKRHGQTVWVTAAVGDESATHSSPILFRYGGQRVIANCSSSHGFGVDADNGDLLWTVPLKNRFGVNAATPIYGAGCVYFVTAYTQFGRLYRLRAEGASTGIEHLWTCPLDTVTGSGVLVDGTLYSAGYRRPKSWFGVDWKTGEMQFELDDFTTGAAIYADGLLYILDERGRAGLVKPGSDGFEVRGRFQLVKERVRDAWAHPVLLDGRLYLRYHDTLWCYEVQ